MEGRNNEIDWAINNRNDDIMFANPQHCTTSREPSVKTSDATSCQDGDVVSNDSLPIANYLRSSKPLQDSSPQGSMKPSSHQKRNVITDSTMESRNKGVVYQCTEV